MKIKSLALKISVIVAFLIAVTIVFILYIALGETRKMVEEIAEEKAAVANSVLNYMLDNLQHEAEDNAEQIAISQSAIDAIQRGDAESLQQELKTYLDTVDIITVCDAAGNVIARGHDDKKGDSVLNQQTVASALKGTGITLIEKGNVSGLSTRASAPIKDKDGKIIAAVVCGHDLSKTDYLDSIKKVIGCEVTIFDGDTVLSTTLADDKGKRDIGIKASADVVDLVIKQKKSFAFRLDLYGSSYSANYTPLLVNGEAIGMLFAGVNIDSLLQHENNLFKQIIIVAISAGIVSVLLMVWFTLVSVRKPLKKISAFAGKLEEGDLGLTSNSQSRIDVRSSDEIGTLARTMEHYNEKLKGYIGEIRDRMNGLSEGDLTTESVYEFHGDFIIIKDSINRTVKNLRTTLGEVNKSAVQVSAGSKQIADGSQTLAQGATEQASSVDELSSSIAEIARKTKENAEMADQAARLANTIMGNAEKGSQQMDAMTTAVKDINAASRSISKVIKVIDDIAFQTNILALNAAVEAARAGQHGKGFAVVAEEVRNLAAKSAKAAKETGDMIQNSMEKAESGSQIAAETAASLADIVSGISESSDIVMKIAKSSEEQSVSIDQINIGIDQVSRVIQMNSATAQESAAASEEMNSQSDALEDLISKFKISEGDTKRRSLPAHY